MCIYTHIYVHISVCIYVYIYRNVNIYIYEIRCFKIKEF